MVEIFRVPGLEVQIIINGQPAKEYADDDEIENEDRTTFAYIEAMSNAEFRFRCIFTPEFPYKTNDIAVIFRIDGKWLECIVVRENELKLGTVLDCIGHRYQKNNQWFERRFGFSELDIVEDHSRKASEQTLARLRDTGKLSVAICRVTGVTTGSAPPVEITVDKLEEISEKALKGQALTHGATLKPQRSIPKVSSLAVTWLDRSDTPLLSYNFKYRSLQKLKGIGIIPRSPSPVPLEERPIETLSVDELRELARQQHERLANAEALQRKLKREHSHVNDEDDAAAAKKSKKIATIDLTDD